MLKPVQMFLNESFGTHYMSVTKYAPGAFDWKLKEIFLKLGNFKRSGIDYAKYDQRFKRMGVCITGNTPSFW